MTEPMAQKSLSCDSLVKVYRSRRVVDGVSLALSTGGSFEAMTARNDLCIIVAPLRAAV